MNSEQYCFCDLAPLYALDLLNGPERNWVEQQIMEDPALAEELAEYERAVTALPYGAPTVEIADNLKQRLFENLELDPPETIAEVSVPQGPELFWTVRAQEIVWQPHPVPGVEVSIFYTDPVRRRLSGLFKAEPGMQYPLHRHAEVEEIYMLSGDLIIGEQVYGAGDYIRSHPGSMHNPHTSTGCMFFFQTSMDDEYFKTNSELRSTVQ
ncbi:MAG: anti-sigma factor [Acaryochloridaceae cyanobacterium RU_4_10]|nr:anti-sigma factor [Acaryochloridaceae cyanobacterium RU_4_10]